MPTLVDEEWSDRIAIVTGAASGVGLALSAWLAAVGAKVVMVTLPGPVLERATVRTNEIERMVTEQALATGVGEEDMVRQFLHRNLIKRLIDPVEVAET